MHARATTPPATATTSPARARPSAAPKSVALCALLALLAVSGCRISRNKDAHDDVSISTPIGGMSVKRDVTAVLEKVGLPTYPGAQVHNDKDGGSAPANVDLSFGGYKLQVLVVNLTTTDDSAAVEAFYRKALSQYSDVIACHDNRPVAQPTKTGMGLTCSKDKHVTTVDTDEVAGDLELKAGSPSRQHIVAIRKRSGETRIDLVSLDLPKGMVE